MAGVDVFMIWIANADDEFHMGNVTQNRISGNAATILPILIFSFTTSKTKAPAMRRGESLIGCHETSLGGEYHCKGSEDVSGDLVSIRQCAADADLLDRNGHCRK